MRIEYEISEDDFVAAGKLALKTKSRLQNAQRFYFPALGVFLIGGVLVQLLVWRNNPTAVVFILFLGSFFIWIGFAATWNLRRQYRKMPILHDRRTLEVDDQGLHFLTRSSESRTTWEPYVRFGEDATTFILFQQGQRIFVPIPKRELQPAEIDQLRELFQAHLARR